MNGCFPLVAAELEKLYLTIYLPVVIIIALGIPMCVDHILTRWLISLLQEYWAFSQMVSVFSFAALSFCHILFLSWAFERSVQAYAD